MATPKQTMGPANPCPCGTPNLPNPFGGPASGLFNGGGGGPSIRGPVGVLPAAPFPPIPPVGPPVPPPNPGIGPAPVILNTAALFKILAKTAITNTGPSSVVGDMGLSPAAASNITGFALALDGSGQFSTSAQVVGRVFAADYAPPTPAKLTQAVLDMQAAYTDASLRLPDAVDLGGGTIGGMTFTPGTYRWNSNVNILSNITLVGGPNDRWIFQVEGTLQVGPNVTIVLAGGAVPANIVWQVSGATTLNPGSVFNGVLLDQTSIAAQTGATLHGKFLSQSAVTLDHFTDP